MAKKSMIAKAKRSPKHPVQAYHRCVVCGRPRAYMRTVRPVPDLLPGACAPRRAAGRHEVELVGDR